MSTTPQNIPPPKYYQRLEGQADWHSTRAGKNKRRYYAVEIILLAAGALIPVINIFSPGPNDLGGRGPFYQRLGSALLAAIVVLAAGIGKLYKFHETWLNYRGVSEGLEREKQLYENRVGEYGEKEDDAGRIALLAERAEGILSTNTSTYLLLHKEDRKQPPVVEKPARSETSQPPGKS
ncbi:MAG: DUF4231 domain-containing protein [Acidobacteria bacterium]|nr:DUF4231 domain-containing protein [Acidobacteriota bacterium]